MDKVLARHMLQRAFAAGQVQRASLPRGLCVALQWEGTQLTVTISRLHGRVRDAEIQDVRIGLGIPAAATRIPAGLSDQARRQEGSAIRYYVAFRYVCAPPETAHVAGEEVVTVVLPLRGDALADDELGYGR